MKLISRLFVSTIAVFVFAGQAPASAAVSLGACAGSLRAPARVAVDAEGTIYVSDPHADQVAIFDAWCRPIGIRTGFARPLGLAVDQQGQIYLAEERKGCVSVFDRQWKLLSKLGIGDGEFQLPSHIALVHGPSGTLVFVSDSKANVVKAFRQSDGRFEFGTLGNGDGQFDFPTGLCASPNGELFVVDQNNDRVQVFDQSGKFLRAFGLSAATGGSSGRAQGAFLDSVGRLYIADTFQGVIWVFDSASGQLLSKIGSFGQGPGQLGSPAGLVLDAFNRLIVTSSATRRLELYGIDSFLHVAARPASAYVASGTTLVLEAMTGDGAATFQWQKDGVNLIGATNATINVAGIGPSATGGYSVVVTGNSGSVTSSVAPIRVLVAPAIASNPQSMSVLSGSDVQLEVGAVGSDLSYQWLLNGVALPGATSASLFIPKAQSDKAGTYSVQVGNQVGSVLSQPALLSIIVPPAVAEVVATSMGADGFHLTLNADPGYRYSLDTSTDLLNWEPLADLVLDSGMQEFVDLESTNYLHRYYRFNWVP